MLIYYIIIYKLLRKVPIFMHPTPLTSVTDQSLAPAIRAEKRLQQPTLSLAIDKTLLILNGVTENLPKKDLLSWVWTWLKAGCVLIGKFLLFPLKCIYNCFKSAVLCCCGEPDQKSSGDEKNAQWINQLKAIEHLNALLKDAPTRDAKRQALQKEIHAFKFTGSESFKGYDDLVDKVNQFLDGSIDIAAEYHKIYASWTLYCEVLNINVLDYQKALPTVQQELIDAKEKNSSQEYIQHLEARIDVYQTTIEFYKEHAKDFKQHDLNMDECAKNLALYQKSMPANGKEATDANTSPDTSLRHLLNKCFIKILDGVIENLIPQQEKLLASLVKLDQTILEHNQKELQLEASIKALEPFYNYLSNFSVIEQQLAEAEKMPLKCEALMQNHRAIFKLGAKLNQPIIDHTGFNNFGLTCWLNTALQCIIRTPSLKKILMGKIEPIAETEQEFKLRVENTISGSKRKKESDRSYELRTKKRSNETYDEWQKRLVDEPRIMADCESDEAFGKRMKITAAKMMRQSIDPNFGNRKKIAIALQQLVIAVERSPESVYKCLKNFKGVIEKTKIEGFGIFSEQPGCMLDSGEVVDFILNIFNVKPLIFTQCTTYSNSARVSETKRLQQNVWSTNLPADCKKSLFSLLDANTHEDNVTPEEISVSKYYFQKAPELLVIPFVRTIKGQQRRQDTGKEILPHLIHLFQKPIPTLQADKIPEAVTLLLGKDANKEDAARLANTIKLAAAGAKISSDIVQRCTANSEEPAEANMGCKDCSSIDMPPEILSGNIDLGILEAFKKLKEQYPSEKFTYRLMSFGVHHGTSLAGGHYTAFARDAQGQWRHYNDEKVNEVESRILSEHLSNSSYIVLERVDTTESEQKKERETDALV